MRSPRYTLHEFNKKDQKKGIVADAAEANCHSCEYTTATKKKNRKQSSEHWKQPETAFKAYDKCFEVNDSSVLDEPVLRLELSLTRQSLYRRLKKKNFENHQEALNAAAKAAEHMISKFIQSSMFTDGKVLRYKDAVSEIENAENIKDKDVKKMTELLKRCSESSNLFYALQKMNLSRQQERNLLKKFKYMGISSVTLPNTSSLYELPSVNKLLSRDG